MAGQKAYDKVIGRGLSDDELLNPLAEELITKDPTQESIQKASITLDWLRHSVTIEMFQELNKLIESLTNRVVELGETYYVHKDTEQIISLLQQIHTYKRIIKLYGTRN